jgi:hypothetical protein
VLRHIVNGNFRVWEMENNQLISVSNLNDSNAVSSSLVI